MHSPQYRERYKVHLKTELPRIPLAGDLHNFAEGDVQLTALHFGYDDDPEYIARLVRKVVTVSVETVKRVAELPEIGTGDG